MSESCHAVTAIPDGRLLASLVAPTSSATMSLLSTPFREIASRGIPARTAGMSGVLMPGQKARIVLESGQDAKPREIGELWVAGGNISPGYYGNIKATQEVFFKDENGDQWYKTGDRFWTDGIWF
jgi:acyl-CoA synthetase (AMP-forming)/AMP-acid ligase II